MVIFFSTFYPICKFLILRFSKIKNRLLLEILTYFTCDFHNIIVKRIQDISRFFDRSSKKRDLSNNSNDDEASKKPKEGSLNTSTSSDIPDYLFTESLKDSECVTILLKCIKK